MTGSDSSSDSSSGSSSTRQRERKRRKQKKEKKRKRETKSKKDKKRKHKHSHERSIVTGKRIQRSEGDRADADGEERRARLREALNGGDESLAKEPPPQRTELEELQHRARFDPALMRELMERGHEAQRAKAAKRGKMPESAARRQYYADLLAESRDEGRR